MKIKLTTNIPVAPKYGLTEGKVLEAKLNPSSKRGYKHWVVIASGEEVYIHAREAELVEEQARRQDELNN